MHCNQGQSLNTKDWSKAVKHQVFQAVKDVWGLGQASSQPWGGACCGLCTGCLGLPGCPPEDRDLLLGLIPELRGSNYNPPPPYRVRVRRHGGQGPSLPQLLLSHAPSRISGATQEVKSGDEAWLPRPGVDPQRCGAWGFQAVFVTTVTCSFM